MADAAVIDAPAEVVSTATPDVSAPPAGDTPGTPSPSSTLEDLVGSFDKLVQPKDDKAKPADPKERVAPKPTEQPKPDKTATPKEDGSKPTPKLYQAHEELKKRVKTEFEPKIQTLEAKIKELESRKPVAPEMKEFETVKQERERLSKELAEENYARSDDFKRDFIEPRRAIYEDAVKTMPQLTVRYQAGTDEEGKAIVKERRATKEDFDAVLELPISQQNVAIEQWFGVHARTVGGFIGEIQRNLRDSQIAVRRHGETRDAKIKETTERAQAEAKAYNQAVIEHKQALETKFPQWFKIPPVDGDTADKELAEAHQAGIELVRKLQEEGQNMKPEDRAAHAAVVLARASSWPRIVVENRRMAAELETLREQVKAKDASDPGAGGTTGAGSTAVPEADGIEAMAAKFDIPR